MSETSPCTGLMQVNERGLAGRKLSINVDGKELAGAAV
jgi:hypothetical protein